MKEIVETLQFRRDNDRPPLDEPWVVTRDGRLWKHGTYVGRLLAYTLTPRGTLIDYEPRPLPRRGLEPVHRRHPECRCKVDQDYSPDCPIHPMPHERAG